MLPRLMHIKQDAHFLVALSIRRIVVGAVNRRIPFFLATSTVDGKGLGSVLCDICQSESKETRVPMLRKGAGSLMPRSRPALRGPRQL